MSGQQTRAGDGRTVPGASGRHGLVRPDRTRLVVGSITFAIAVAAFARIPVLPDIGADLDLSAGEIGLLTTAFGLGRLVMDLPAGRLAANVRPALALAGAGAGLAVAAGLLAAAGTLGIALVASALMGCASALTNTTSMYAFATATDATRRGASMAIYTTALMSGQMVGPALGGVIASIAGWREAMAVAGAIGAVVAIAATVWWRRDRRRTDIGAGAGATAGDIDAGTHAGRAELAALATAPFATFFGMAGLTQTLIPLIGNGELGLSASAIGIALALGAAARFGSAWVAGIVSDRFSRKVVLVPSLLTMALGAAVLALPPGAVGWSLGILLIALGSSGISVAAAAVADWVPAHRLGHELGVFRLLGDVGLLIGPAATGFAYGASGPALAGGLSAAVFVAAALAAAIWVRGGGAPADFVADTGEFSV